MPDTFMNEANKKRMQTYLFFLEDGSKNAVFVTGGSLQQKQWRD